MAARERIAETIIRTPLVRLQIDDAPAEIWLKLENLQPIGSFKLRGAANAVLSAPRDALAEGLVTTSTGNMAQGVAWMARELGVPATIVVPDNASAAKLAAVERLGGRIVRVPWEQWWAAVEADEERDLGDDVEGFFVHPVQDPPVMAGNGTIGLELVEQLDDIDAVLIPWGGGGLTTGIASAAQAAAPGDGDLRVRAGDGRAGHCCLRSPRNPGAGRVPAVVHRRRRLGQPLASDVGARAAAPRRIVRRDARGRSRGGASPDGTRANRRGRRSRARGRRRTRRSSRRGPCRVHRLGREHRLGSPRSDPRRPRSDLVDERAPEAGECFTLEGGLPLVARIEDEDGGEKDRENASSQPRLVVDRAVDLEESVSCVGR